MRSSIKYLLSCVMSLVAFAASAYDFLSDGIAYTITSFTELKCAIDKAEEPYKDTVIIPNTVIFNGKELEVNEIASECFRNCIDLTDVVFNDRIESIGNMAFSECIALEVISIPNTVKSIGQNVFQGCYILKKINLPEEITYVPKGFIRDCPLIETFIIPESVETIKQSAFEGCKNLQKITIPASVTTIEDNVFDNCGLKDIVFCNSEITLSLGTSKSYRTGMGWKAHTVYLGLFETCPLENVILGRNLEYKCELDFRIKGSGNQEKYLDIWYPPFRGTSFKNLTITSSVENLPENALYGCTLSGTLSIEDCINKIRINPIYFYEEAGREAYNNLNNLTPDSLYIGRNLEFYSDSFALKNKIFPWKLNTENLSNLIFSDFVTDIDDIKLTGNKEKLRSVYIGNKIKKIYHDQFKEIPNINNVYLGESIQEIESYAFRNCSSLKEIILPQSLATIGSKAFDGCPITTLKLPAKIKSISTAFDSCKLDSIYIENPNPPSSSGYSNEIYLNCKLFVPYGKIDLYKNSDPWANFWNIEEFGDTNSVTNIYEERQEYIINRLDVNGNKVDELYKGIVIVRYSDGSTKKIIQK